LNPDPPDIFERRAKRKLPSMAGKVLIGPAFLTFAMLVIGYPLLF
jgi:hypothetical protein